MYKKIFKLKLYKLDVTLYVAVFLICSFYLFILINLHLKCWSVFLIFLTNVVRSLDSTNKSQRKVINIETEEQCYQTSDGQLQNGFIPRPTILTCQVARENLPFSLRLFSKCTGLIRLSSGQSESDFQTLLAQLI